MDFETDPIITHAAHRDRRVAGRVLYHTRNHIESRNRRAGQERRAWREARAAKGGAA